PGRTPNSSLFPYTTLFRSELRKGRLLYIYRPLPGGRAEAGYVKSSKSRRTYSLQTPSDPSSVKSKSAAIGASNTVSNQPGRTHTDRKSTRLNSSHSQISYA